MVDILNPLVLPALKIIGGATGIGIFLTIILRLVHQADSSRYKAAWLKLGILIGITTVLISAGALGSWGMVPVILFLAGCGWYELMQCIDKKYGTVSTPLLVLLLGTLGTLGGIYGFSFASYFGVVATGWVAIALPMLLSRAPVPMHGLLGTAFGMLFISMPLSNLLALVGAS